MNADKNVNSGLEVQNIGNEVWQRLSNKHGDCKYSINTTALAASILLEPYLTA